VPDALVTAMERAKELALSNVVFICDDAALLSDWFAPGEIDRMYINFCDPWPSKKHAKRRLTFEGFLKSYRDILCPGGQIHFKTDNRPLFEFSLTQFPRAGYDLSEVSFDLHADDPDVIMTDFEAVFHEQGVKINRCVGTLTALPDTLGEAPKLSLLDYWQEGDPIPRGMDKYVEEWRIRQRLEAQKQSAEA
jgi:tRNA (guanine-N7-)-methyltransferase